MPFIAAKSVMFVRKTHRRVRKLTNSSPFSLADALEQKNQLVIGQSTSNKCAALLRMIGNTLLLGIDYRSSGGY
jgi:hypothetical protein